MQSQICSVNVAAFTFAWKACTNCSSKKTSKTTEQTTKMLLNRVTSQRTVSALLQAYIDLSCNKPDPPAILGARALPFSVYALSDR